MKQARFLIMVACVVAATAGCNGRRLRDDFEFDGSGWGGPFLEYTFNRLTGTYRIVSGALVNRDFRWADSRVSFEFLDKPSMVWGLVLLDPAFGRARREWMRDGHIKIAPGKWKRTTDLGYEDLWTYDRVAELTVRRGSVGRAYTVLDAWWDNQFIDGRRSVTLRAVRDVKVRRNTWNTLSLQIARGVLTYTLNGQPCRKEERLKIDPRADGRLGIFVHKSGGPLLIRNLKFVPPAPTPAPQR